MNLIIAYVVSILITYLGLLMAKWAKAATSEEIKVFFWLSFVPILGTLVASFFITMMFTAIIIDIIVWIAKRWPKCLKL